MRITMMRNIFLHLRFILNASGKNRWSHNDLFCHLLTLPVFFFNLFWPTGGEVCPHRRQQSLHPAAFHQHRGKAAGDRAEDDRQDCGSNDTKHENSISSAYWGHSAQNQTEFPAGNEHAYQETRLVHLLCSLLFPTQHLTFFCITKNKHHPCLHPVQFS